MTLGRLFGDRLAARFGPRALVRTGCVCAALGLGGSLVAQTTVAGFAGFALLGAGVATIIPITFRTAAATIPTAPAAAVASVSTLAWLGFLIGPPVIGQIAAATTLPWALVLVVVALLAIVLLAGVLNPRSTAAAAAEARGRPAPAR
jgi:MFS family permease